MIEPSETLFYEIITESFPRGTTFASRAVNKIKIVKPDDPLCQTLCIDPKGVVRVNPEFWRKYVKTKADAKFVLLHEMFHSVLGDTTTMSLEKDAYERQLMNLSMDMRINAAIWNFIMKMEEKNYRHLLYRLYPKSGINGLLRPGSVYSNKSKYSLLYKALYLGGLNHSESKKVEEMFQNEETIRAALKVLIKKTKANEAILAKVKYIGSHNDGEEEQKLSSDEENDKTEEDLNQEGEDSNPQETQAPPIAPESKELDEDLADEMREQMIEALQAGGDGAGAGGFLFKNIVEVIESSQTVKMHALQAFACDHKVNQIKAMFEKPRKVSSMVPLTPSNKELVLLSAGMTPWKWTNRAVRQEKLNKNIAVYLDVSGSVTDYLPKLLGVIQNLRQGIKTVFCFSTILSEHTMEELSEGKFETSWGTDFNCIVRHAVENKIDKMIILTDGCANINTECRALAEEHIKDAAIVFFGYKNKDNFFSNRYGKNFDLEDLVTK